MTTTTLIIVAALVLAIAAVRSRRARDGDKPTRGLPRRARDRCPTGKVPFETQADADRVVRRSQSQPHPGYNRPLQRSYRCPHCNQWHTTSQRKRINW